MKNKRFFANATLVGALLFAFAHLANALMSFFYSRFYSLTTDGGLYYNWKFGSVFYTKTGSGPPLLLIHDLNPASSGHEWHKILPALSRTNTVYTLDLPGCGRSDKPAMVYTDFLYVQLIADFIKDIVHDKACLLSTGASCGFTLATSAYDSEAVNNIFLVNPKCTGQFKPQCNFPFTLRLMLYLPVVGTFVYRLFFCRPAINKVFVSDYFKNSSRIRDEDVNAYTKSAHAGKGAGKFLHASIISGLTGANVVHALENFDNELSVLVGEECLEGAATAANYLRIRPSLTIFQIKDCKYLPHLESSDKVINKLTSLVNDLT